VRIALTPGERHELTQIRPLLDDLPVRCLIADRAYDSDGLIAWLERRGVEVVIPPRSTSPQRPISWLLYWLRNVVERAFCRLKQFRRVATRYKTSSSYSAFVHLAAATLWL
jgi:transposase